MHQKRVTCELHGSYFRSMTIKHAIPRTAEVQIPMVSYGKRSRGRGGVSAREFDSNIRPTNWTKDSEKFRFSRKLLPSLPRVRFLGHRLLTSKSPGLIDERFLYLSWLLLLHTSFRRENKYILLYILRVVVCLARAKRNNFIPKHFSTKYLIHWAMCPAGHV